MILKPQSLKRTLEFTVGVEIVEYAAGEQCHYAVARTPGGLAHQLGPFTTSRDAERMVEMLVESIRTAAYTNLRLAEQMFELGQRNGEGGNHGS